MKLIHIINRPHKAESYIPRELPICYRRAVECQLQTGFQGLLKPSIELGNMSRGSGEHLHIAEPLSKSFHFNNLFNYLWFKQSAGTTPAQKPPVLSLLPIPGKLEEATSPTASQTKEWRPEYRRIQIPTVTLYACHSRMDFISISLHTFHLLLQVSRARAKHTTKKHLS